MKEQNEERLYNLLPAIYRQRDAKQGEPLRALMAVIESELQVLEKDIERLYNNWFIETCDEWIVPYIGDLLDVHNLQAPGPGTFSQRAYVANTLAYRRRKGTIFVLEQLARDITGWPAKAVEFFQLLITTQNLNHVRPANLMTPNLRDMRKLMLLDSPFDRAAHTAEVRRIATGEGKYNIRNVGLFLWRLQSYAVTESTARKFKEGRYWFSPLGYDTPLFNHPQTEREITHLAEEINVPGRLRRRFLYDELEGRREALKNGKKPEEIYFGEQPALQVYLDGNSLLPEEILICNLDDWDRVNWKNPGCMKYTKKAEEKEEYETYTAKVAVDPELGRLALLEGIGSSKVQVSYSYGFSADVGGGPYNRQLSLQKLLDPSKLTWSMGITQNQSTHDEASEPDRLKKSLKESIEAWNTYVKGKPDAYGLITIMDSDSYAEAILPAIDIPAGSRLAIVAADWPQVEISGKKQRLIDQLVPDGLHPHLQGDLSVKCKPIGTTGSGELLLDGLLIEGKLTVLEGNLSSIKIAHCTLAPNKGGLTVEKQNEDLDIQIDHSICGSINLPKTVPGLSIIDSIIDGVGGSAIDAKGAHLELQRSTVFGEVNVQSTDASNSIFTENLGVERQQYGCVRFCCLPQGSKTPRRYHCQPDLTLKASVKNAGKSSSKIDPSEKALILSRLKPNFSSKHYDSAGYAQLSQACVIEIRTGAEDGSEMGVFSSLKQPQREANLRSALNEYLRFGLEAGIFYVN